MKKLWEKVRKSNSGFSFIELLVAFAIMAVIMGISAFSLGLPASTQAKEVTYNIDALLSRTKTSTLMKTGNVYMAIRMDGKGQVVLDYYENDVLKSRDTLSDPDKVQIKYGYDTSTAPTSLQKNEALCFAFDRRTTGFETLADGAALLSSGGVGSGHCKVIYISAGAVEYEIVLGPVTGTHTASIK